MNKRNPLILATSLLTLNLISLLIIYYLLPQLFIIKDKQMTNTLIEKSLGLISIIILGLVLVVILNLLVSFVLRHYLFNIDRQLTLIMGLLRVMYSVVLLIGVVILILDTNYEGVLSFYVIYFCSLSFLGLNNILISILLYRALDINRIVSVLLMICGMGYILGSIYSFITLTLIPYMMVFSLGEIVFLLWLMSVGRQKQIRI
ncbi:MAG: DUF4386 family protein [Erysipelothrix sp.]|nr:DUF4386 family protein [Erysipelothrix sp.]